MAGTIERAATLQLDERVYPRQAVDQEHVRALVAALDAGVSLPAVVVERETRRVVDGFHRVQAVLERDGAAAKIAVDWQTYPDEAALFLDAVRRNAQHGRRLTPADQLLVVERAESEWHIAPAYVAKALALTVERIGALTLRPAQPVRAVASPEEAADGWAAMVRPPRERVAIPPTEAQVLATLSRTIKLLGREDVHWERPKVVARLRELVAATAERLAVKQASA